MTTTTKNNQLDLSALEARLMALEAENKKLREAKTVKRASSMMKFNKSNGIYFTTPSMKAYSDKHNKEYQCGINIPQVYAIPFINALKSGEFQKLAEKFLASGANEVSF
jgi:hypothetical protein